MAAWPGAVSGAKGRVMTLRKLLLVGCAFTAGAVAAPTLGQFAHTLGASPGILAAHAADGPADTDRLLALFGSVFDRVRADYVEPVPPKKLVENALNGMLSGLDPHSSYMDQQAFQDMQVQTRGQFGGLGLEVTQDKGYIKVVSPIDGTPAARAGIKPGDLVVALDDKTTQGLTLSEAVQRMRGTPGSTIRLTIARENLPQPIQVTLSREIIHVQVVHQRLFGDIGYIRLTTFDEQADSAIRQAVRSLEQQAGGHLRGFILDLRNDPGGLLDQAVAVASDFLDRGEIVATRGRHTEDDKTWYARAGGDILTDVPMVVLINDGTASASEIVAGALQDDGRAVLLGTRSFGKGSVQTVIPLPGYGAIRLTTARYYTPSGRSIQGQGIAPDIIVMAGRDERTQFGPMHESDLNHVLSNGGDHVEPARPRNDLPPIASSIPQEPPVNWPKYDQTKPETDFQLQQALTVVRAMANQHRASTQ